MRALEHLLERFRSHKRGLFVIAGVGLAVCLALIFLLPSSLGFVLIAPLAFCPWFLACASIAKSRLAAYPFMAFAALTLIWPLFYL
jgi:hypothetical protein